MERKLAIVGLLGVIFAVIAADYGVLGKNIANFVNTLEASLHINLTVLAVVITIPFTFTLLWISPLWLRSIILGHQFSGVQVFGTRDDMTYQKLFEKELRRCAAIDIIGIGNSQITEKEMSPLLLEAVGVRRVSLRVLFLDPEGDCVKMRDKDEGYKRGWIAEQVRQHCRHFERLREEIGKKYPHSKQLIKYAYHDSYPTTNAIFFDGKAMFIQPYFYSIRGRANPIVYFHAQHSKIVASLAMEFEAMWKNSRQP